MNSIGNFLEVYPPPVRYDYPKRENKALNEAEIQKTVQEMARRIVDGFRPDQIILFGSCASGKPSRDSDIDLLVVMPVKKSCRLQANEIDLALADRSMPLDLIVLTPEKFDRQKNLPGTIVFEAVRTGKVIYARAA
jgi:predicted nucleotidyltransferase